MIDKPIFNINDITILEEQTVYKGFGEIIRYKLKHRLYQGGWTQPFEREIYHGHEAVAVLPYDPIRRQVVLIEQFRAGALDANTSPWLLEIVAGLVKPGERLEEVAKRELQEETGLECLEIRPIYQFQPTPGSCTEQVALFLCHVDASQLKEHHGLADENEDIKAMAVDVNEVYQAISTGRINNAFAIIAIQWLQLHEEKCQ